MSRRVIQNDVSVSHPQGLKNKCKPQINTDTHRYDSLAKAKTLVSCVRRERHNGHVLSYPRLSACICGYDLFEIGSSLWSLVPSLCCLPQDLTPHSCDVKPKHFGCGIAPRSSNVGEHIGDLLVGERAKRWHAERPRIAPGSGRITTLQNGANRIHARRHRYRTIA